MHLSLTEFLKVILFFMNAIAILNEERFLSRGKILLWILVSPKMIYLFLINFLVGWGYSHDSTRLGQSPTTVHSRMVHLIYAIRTVFRIPLIILNTLMVLFLLILG
jgi:hypothetical protein